jgi:uncharacterized protein (TIGR00296 family)
VLRTVDEEIEPCSNNYADVNTVATAKKTTSKELLATDSMCFYCFDILIQELRKKAHRGATSDVQPFFVDSLPNRSVECPLFVTWEKQSRPTRSNYSRALHHSAESSYELRGCIGSLTPKVLLRNLREYAVYSAFQDHRFDPVTVEEVAQLRVSVSLLIQYETCQDCHDWTVGTHGIIIKFHPAKADGCCTTPDTKSRATSGELSATFLPEVPMQQNWDQKKTVHHLIRKAGYKGSITDHLLQSIHCTRYQSSKCKISFHEYMTRHLGLQSTTDGEDDDSKQFIKGIIEGNAIRSAARHGNDASTHNCCIM